MRTNDRRFAMIHSIRITGALLCAATIAHADTLELRNGSTLNGTFAGATAQEMKFDVAGQTLHFPLGDIARLSLDEVRPAVAPAAAAAPSGPGAARTEAAGAAPTRIVVPGGTTISVRMRDTIDSGRQGPGYRFTAALEMPLTVGSRVVAPKGAAAYGRLVETRSAGRVVGDSELRIELTEVVIEGRPVPVHTSAYSEKTQGQGRDSVGKVARGAVIGGLIDGSDGAKTGAKVGAGAAVLTRGAQVRVPAGSLIEFRTLSPVEVDLGGGAAARPAPAATTETAPGPTSTAARPGSTADTATARPPQRPAAIPAGTALLIRTRDSIDSRRHRSGHRFTCALETALVVDGATVAPAGSLVYGQLISTRTGGRLRGRTEVHLELTDMVIDGRRVPIRSNGCIAKGGDEARNSVGKVARGAVIGGLIDGSDGARTGAAVGAGAALLTRGQRVAIPAGSLLEFRLASPAQL